MDRTRRIIAATGLLALAVSACSSPAAPSWNFAAAKPAASQAAPAASAAPAVAASDAIAIEAFDLGFTPASVQVPAAGTYPVTFTNTGSTLHDITFADGTTLKADAGQAATGTVTVPAAGLAFICSIPGHADAGMKGEVTVGDGMGMMPAASAAPAAPAAAGASTAPVADPNAPAYTLYDPKAPALLPGTVHDIDLPIIEKDITVADGFVVHAWTFGGTVPGPTIRVHLGDTVNVHLTNQGQMSHSIDFHASQTAMNHQMVEIKPGETFTYTFTADYAGVWMYHCGTAPALHHIANGMFGMVIVEPKGGLPKVDNEFAFVQSEWYLGAQGQPADYAKANQTAASPDFVVFNGVANQYKDNPVQVKTGGRVRVFVLDAGPNMDSSFHVVGTIFDTVHKEGVSLERGNAQGWGSQAVDLSPAQGAIIEFSPVEDGMYPFVTHAFNLVGHGAIGIFSAGDGDPMN
ncbi:MAG TPA: multicopper oxidase domain-containing protein [Candidatus Limnocylindrales bacterium]|nr:multicopper oxidase domain-containing protein [Candidatus Limnocylindrales bacterium]